MCIVILTVFFDAEGLFKVKGCHAHCNVNVVIVSETVRGRVVATTDH